MSFEQGPENKESRDKTVIRFDSRDEAVEIVKAFWRAMPHAVDLTLPSEDDREGWASELTAGDRTRVSQGFMPRDKDKWILSISGNHQPLTPEAEAWLKERGY